MQHGHGWQIVVAASALWSALQCTTGSSRKLQQQSLREVDSLVAICHRAFVNDQHTLGKICIALLETQ